MTIIMPIHKITITVNVTVVKDRHCKIRTMARRAEPPIAVSITVIAPHSLCFGIRTALSSSRFIICIILFCKPVRAGFCAVNLLLGEQEDLVGCVITALCPIFQIICIFHFGCADCLLLCTGKCILQKAVTAVIHLRLILFRTISIEPASHTARLPGDI